MTWVKNVCYDYWGGKWVAISFRIWSKRSTFCRHIHSQRQLSSIVRWVLCYLLFLCFVFFHEFSVLRMSTSLRVYKIVCAVHLQVTKSHVIDTTIGCPYIRHDCCTRCNHLLDDLQQSRPWSIWHTVHKAFSWLTIYTTKNPLLG